MGKLHLIVLGFFFSLTIPILKETCSFQIKFQDAYRNIFIREPFE